MNPASTTTTTTSLADQLALAHSLMNPRGLPAPRPGFSVEAPQQPRVVVFRPRLSDEPPSARLARARDQVQQARGLMVNENTRKAAIQALRAAVESTRGCPGHLRTGTMLGIALACADAAGCGADVVQCFHILADLCWLEPAQAAALRATMRPVADAILQRPNPFDIGWRTALVWRMQHPEGLQPAELGRLHGEAQAPYVGAMVALDKAFHELDSEDDVNGPAVKRALRICLSQAQSLQGAKRAETFEQLGAACLDSIERRANEEQCLAMLDLCCTEVSAQKAAEFRADLVRTVTAVLADEVDRGDIEPHETADERALLHRALQPGFVALAQDKSGLLHLLSQVVGIAWTREELRGCIAQLRGQIERYLPRGRERDLLWREIMQLWREYTPGDEQPDERTTLGRDRIVHAEGRWCEVAITHSADWTRAVARDLLRCGATVEVSSGDATWHAVANADAIAYEGSIHLRFCAPRGLDAASVRAIPGGYEFSTSYDRFSASLIQDLCDQWATVQLAFEDGAWQPLEAVDARPGNDGPPRPVAIRILLNENFTDESARQFLAHHAESGMDGANVFAQAIWAPALERRAAEQAVRAATAALADL